MATRLMSEVLVLLKASVCWKDAAKLMNCPSSVEVIYHTPSALACGPSAPKSIVNDGDTVWLLPTCEPMIVKAMSRSFEFSMIFCCADVMLKSCALPFPLFCTRMPSANGMEGSICGVKGSSLYTSCWRSEERRVGKE